MPGQANAISYALRRFNAGGGAAAFVQTRSGVVDGVDEYIDLGTPAAFSGLDVHLTAATWFKTEQHTACDIFGKWEGVGINRDWLIYMASGIVHAYINTSIGPAGIATGSAYDDGAWHLAVMTWDGATLTIDIDGGAERQTVAAADRLGNAGSKALLGARDDGLGGGLGFYSGNIDEAAFCSGLAISAAQCVELYALGGPATAGDLSLFTGYAGLTSWYRLGDYPGDSMDSGDPAARIFDAKGSNDGTPVNTEAADVVYDVPPTFNRLSLLTDGVDEYADRAGGSVTGCEFDWDEPFSVNVWIRSTFTGSGYILSKMAAGTQRGWAVGVLSGKPFFLLANNVGGGVWLMQGVDQLVSAGAWKMVTWVYSGSGLASGVTTYINGTSTFPIPSQITYNDTLASSSTTGGGDLGLGRFTGGGYFPGHSDEVSIWNKALSAIEVAALMDADAAPANLAGAADLDAWYRCGEAVGDSATGTIFDVSGNSNDLTCNNMEAIDINTSTARPFWNLLSVGFDGVDERFYSSPAANAPTYDTADTFSVSCWFKTSTATYGVLVAKESTSPSYIGWSLYMHPGGSFRVELSAGGAAYIDQWTQFSTGWNDGSWHHILMTYEGNGVAAGVKVYLDSALAATTVLADALAAGSILTGDPFTIGARGGSAIGAWLPYAGRVDDVSVYSATLSAPQAVELFNGGKPRDAMGLSSASDLDAYYRCGDATFDAVSLVQPSLYDVSGSSYDLSQANMEQADFDLDVP